ncbi:MAG: hypothetical protein COT35_07265 [Nitrospirae bacterium CG08_land_8_20_14_0_20_52_24]|nr:MAG: hypothetical protein COT35_07265 [Nitrospirae bacterium CG08_land_8_20_14_0_20_52_24]
MKKWRWMIAVSVLFAGCTGAKAPSMDPAVLQETVTEYNRLLSQGYRNLNMNPLADVATEDQAQEVYYHMTALGEERKRMEADLREISFLDTHVSSPDQAEVRTREAWDYKHVNIDSKALEYEDSMVYQIKYQLVKRQDHWLVDDVTIEEEQSRSGGKSLEEAKHGEAGPSSPLR